MCVMAVYVVRKRITVKGEWKDFSYVIRRQIERVTYDIDI